MERDEKARQKDRRTLLRRARSALRKLEKAESELARLGELSNWETEFIASVTERLDTYNSAFANPELGGRLEALSAKQKQVLAQMRRKIKDKSRQAPSGHKDFSGPEPESESESACNPAFRTETRTPQEVRGPQPKATPKPFLRIIDGDKT